MTIKDIARLAEVSRGTVDRVLNNRGGVSQETEKKIAEIMNVNNYVPNIAGKILANKKNPLTFGVIIPKIGNDFFIDVIIGINRAVSELCDFGIKVVIKEIEGYNTDVQLDAVENMKGINGLIIAPANDERLTKKLSSLKIPIIAINTDIENSDRLCYIGHEFKKGGRTAAGLMNLFTSGEVNVGIVTGFTTVLGHNYRISGFLEVIKEQYKNINLTDITESHDNDETAFLETEKMLKRHPEINALYVTAGGVSGVCRAAAGKSLTIITYDDIPDTKKFILDGTIKATLCQEPVKQGYQSVKTLFDYLISGKPPENEYMYTDVIIKIKENM